jgi:hypothetical protein
MSKGYKYLQIPLKKWEEKLLFLMVCLMGLPSKNIVEEYLDKKA